jgi:hypothetical protein
VRSGLATLHNLDLHYQLAQQPADVKDNDSGPVAALSNTPVRNVQPWRHVLTFLKLLAGSVVVSPSAGCKLFRTYVQVSAFKCLCTVLNPPMAWLP